MRYISIIVLSVIVTNLKLFAQADIVLNTPLTKDVVITATHSIVLEPGFNSNNFTASFNIDPLAIPPILLRYSSSEIIPCHDIALSSKHNYIRVIEPREAFAGSLPDNCYYDAKDLIQYFDGLGRPNLGISVKASPTGADVLQLTKYDEFGRESTKYLPYTKASNDGQYIDPSAALTEQQNFYAATGVNYATDPDPWAKTVFEPSPLNRVQEQGAPGADWQPDADDFNGRTVKTRYSTINSGTIKHFVANTDLTSIVQDGTYNAGKLVITETEDENRNITREYKNLHGQVVLKEAEDGNGNTLQTYYVYDDFGQLRCVIPPKAEGDPTKTELCFYYQYDGRRNMVQKKLPGASVVNMVYDIRDRLVAIQDGNLSEQGKWLVTKYDALNRPVITALYTGRDLAAIKLKVDDNSGDLAEEFVGNSVGNIHGYNNSSFPDDLLQNDVITVTYYDNYNALSGISGFEFRVPDNSGLTNSAFNFTPVLTSDAKGLATVTKTKVLGTDSDYLLSVVYYDEKARAVQVVSYNYMGGIDAVSTNYNFVGENIATINEHSDGTNKTVIGDCFVYDLTGRLLENWEQIGGEDEILLVANKYNELGKPAEKYLYGSDFGIGITALQKTDYTYNIRGWLSGINNPDNLSAENDLFAMNLFYNNPGNLQTGLSAEPQFNGNISAMRWEGALDEGSQKAYAFGYDSLNRLLTSTFGTSTNGSSWTSTTNYSENLSYDANGNIQTLQRNDANGNLIDDLVYKYLDEGNQLDSVRDNAPTATKGKGFIDGNTKTGDYSYDANGNMLTDKNKGITTNISYNYLNLPESVTHNGSLSSYVYSAAGVKLAHYDQNLGTTTKYCGNFVYENGVLKYILTPEGRILPKANGGYQYEFHLDDQLGNTRLVFKDENNDGYISSGEISQVADYYPFGLRFEPKVPDDADQKYLYNGKEYQDDLDWYDYGWRQYDPALARFTTQDAFAEKYESLTPYQYAANNPVLYVDVNGDSLMLFENGNYVGTYDNGKKEITGYNQETKTDKKGNKTFTGGQSFNFNDQEVDPQAVRNGVITKVEFVSDKKFNDQLSKSGVTTGGDKGYGYAFIESHGGGKMDYGMQGIKSGDLNKNTFYVREGTAYNVADFGNYLWGAGMMELKIPLEIAKFGAHYNNFMNGRTGRDYTPEYDFGPGTYGQASWLDDPADQRAIEKGWYYVAKQKVKKALKP